MLARFASNLYWMSRYLERAENMARILDVGQSMAMLAQIGLDDGTVAEPLQITGNREAFESSGLRLTSEQVARYLSWDVANGSSIYNCLRAARENARAVRSSITTEMWENINDTWLQLLQKRHQEDEPAGNAFFEWVKERSHLFRGKTFATARRRQPYQFIRLGTFVERADNTARILSVKGLSVQSPDVPQEEPDPSSELLTDYYRLSAVLRSVSAFEAYRDTYRDSVDAGRVAELLIVDPDLPRSLRFCFDEVKRILDTLGGTTGKPARRKATTILANVEFAEMSEIGRQGLDAFLNGFLSDLAELDEALSDAYLDPK